MPIGHGTMETVVISWCELCGCCKCVGEAGGDGEEGEDVHVDFGDGPAEAVARDFESGGSAGGEEHQLQRPELP